MNTITNSDDIIDSRDIIERIEDLQALRKPWVAGWNMPGYLPDSEPCAFESYDDAREYLIDELQRVIDEDTNEINADAMNSLIEARKRFEEADEGELGETVGNYHYFLSQDTSATAGLDPDDAEELIRLRQLASEGENYADDWQYGAQLIRDSYFTEAMQALCEDIGVIPCRALPSYLVIDWEATARNLRVDYTSVDFDGVTYWVR